MIVAENQHMTVISSKHLNEKKELWSASQTWMYLHKILLLQSDVLKIQYIY